MSKPRGHHFIPQFLLRAFASRRKGDQYFVQVFPKGRSPYEQNVCDVAKKRDFHDSLLEVKMADRESVLAAIHRRLLEDGIHGCNRIDLESLVIHLFIRTKHLRDSMTAMGESVLDSLSKPSSRNSRQFKRALEKASKKALVEGDLSKTSKCKGNISCH